ncbi:quinone oxidoreductase-like protein 2 [Tanacetum coccineum]
MRQLSGKGGHVRLTAGRVKTPLLVVQFVLYTYLSRFECFTASLIELEALVCKKLSDPTISPDSSENSPFTFSKSHPIPKLITPTSVRVRIKCNCLNYATYLQVLGSFAQFLVAEENELCGVPDGCDLVDAAAIPIAYGTSIQALVHRTNIKSGQLTKVSYMAYLMMWIRRILQSQAMVLSSSKSLDTSYRCQN